MTTFESVSAVLGLGRGTAWILLGILGCLTAGAVVRGIAIVRRPDERSRQRWSSLLSWWALFIAIVAALSIGRSAVILFMGLVSLVALRESIALTAAAGAEARAIVVAVLVALVGPGFVVAVASLPPPRSRPEESMGWLLLLLLLTELNDITQAWWGRALGARQLAPELSPNKTWEGLAGGIGSTLLAAALLAPVLSDYGRLSPLEGAQWLPPWSWPLLLGLVVSTAGIAGDLSVSWLKRSAGVKDAGDVLPGQGGLLDRIDSLALTAPVYFALTWLLWFAGR